MDYFASLDPSNLDPDIPTIFEILSAKQLQGLISPSLRYILVFYAQRHPQCLLKLVNKYDELYLLVMGLVEYNHLKNWNSSFTEKFYGLKRSREFRINPLNTKQHAPRTLYSQTRLSRTQVLGCLFFLVGLPYIKEKLDARYEKLKGKYAFRSIDEARQIIYDDPETLMEDRVWFEVDRLIYKAYPTVAASESLISLAFYLLFLFSKTTASGPVDLLLGTKYVRFNQFDYAEDDRRQLASSKSLVGRVKAAAVSSFSYVLPTSMFLLKFLEWWSNSDFARQLSRNTRSEGDENLPLPVQPKHVGSRQGLCPLCDGEMENPTAIETGVVFCYRCIFDYLQDRDPIIGCYCPVTGQRLLLCRYSEGSWSIGGLRRLIV